MPKGVPLRDGDMKNPNSSAYRYKEAETDPNSGVPQVVEEPEVLDIGAFHSEEITRIFIQMASLTNLDVEDTYQFMSKFVVGNDSITKTQIADLIEKHRDQILIANRSSSLFINAKYEYTSPLKNLSIINTALQQIDKVLTITKRKADGFTIEDDLDTLKDFANVQRTLSIAYKNWVERTGEWIKMIGELITDPSYYAQIESGEDMKSNSLTASGVASLLEENDMPSETASRLATVIVYGEQKLDDHADSENGKYFQEEENGNDLVSTTGDEGPVF